MSRVGGAQEEEEEEGVDIDSVKCALQAEQDHVQKRTFTNWVNAQLAKHKTPSVVQDLYQDLRDGHQLLDLLEVLSGQQLDHERNRTHPIHWRSNVGTALKFLRTNSVKLVNINVPDIVEGKSTIILGLLWSIISHFQVEKLAMGLERESGQGVPSPPVTSSPTGTPPPKRGRFHSVWKRSAKQALLNWAQEKTRGLPVTIQDLSGSWRNGLAFAAVINALQPGLLDPAEFQHKSDIENLETVFWTAERKLGIPRLLEAQDLAVQKPDEKSIITYLSQFVKYSKELPVGELDTEVEGTPRFLESLGDQSTQDAEHSALQADVMRDFEDSRRQIEACIQGAVLFLQDKGSPGELIAKHQETVRSFDSGVLQRFLDATHKVLTTAGPQKSRVVSELREELCQKWALVHSAVTAHLQRLNSAVEPSGMAHPESGMEADLGTWRVRQQTSVGEGGGLMGAKQHLMTRQLAEGGSAHRVSAGLNPELTGGEHGAREPGELSEARKLAAREPDPEVLRTSEQCWPGSQEEVDGLVVTLSGREPSGDLVRTDLSPRTVAGRGGEGGPARQEPPLFGAVAKDQARGEGPEGPPLPPRLLLPGKWKVQRFPTADIPGTNEPALPARVSLEAWEESAQLQGGSSAGREQAFARAGTDRVPVGAFSEWQQGGGGQTAGEQGEAATVEEPPRAVGRPGSPAGYRVVQPGEWELAAVPDPGVGGGSESQHADPLAAESPVRGSAVALSVGGQPVGAESGQAAPPPTGGLNPEGQARAFPVPPEGSRDHSQAAPGGQAQSHSRHGQAAQKTGEPPSEEHRPPAVPGDVRAQGGSPVTQRAGAEGISARGEVQGDAHTTGSAGRFLQEAGRSPLVKDPTVWDGRAWASSGELPVDPRTQGDDGVGGGVRWTIPHRAAGETSAGETLDVGSSTVDLSGGHLTQDNADFLAQESFTAQSWPIPDYSQPPRESMDSSHMTNVPAREDCGKSAVATEEESFGIPDLSLTEPRETGLQDHEGREREGRSSGDAVRRYETAREGLERMRLGAWAGTDPHRQPTLSDLREKLHEVQAAQTEVSSRLSVPDAEMMEEQVLPGTDPHLRHTAPRSVRVELVLLQQALQRREQSLSSALTALEGLEEQIPLLQNCLLQFQNQPVVLTGSSLKLEPHLQLLKHLQTAIESQVEACEAVSGGGSECAGSLEPEDRRAVCSIARDCARRYQEIGTQAQAAASALCALDGFLQSLRAADPDGRGRLGQEGAAETPTPGSAEEIECLWNRALQLDEALSAARVCLDDGGSSGGRVWCRDLVARLGCRGEAARRQDHLPQEEVYGELCVRQERLVRHLQDIELRAGAALLREATVPAVQGRLDSLKELEHELQQTEVALGELRTLAQQLVSSGSGLAGEAQRRLQAAEKVWSVTASNVQDWKDHYFVLVGFLREFQNHKKDLISSIEKGQDLIPPPPSYMDKAKLRQLMTDIDAVKHEVSTQQEKLDELRNICRHLQSNLRKVMDTGSLPFQREADDLVDQWLDVTERLESYGSRLQRALSLWDGLTECGRQMGERARGRPDPPGESVCRQEPAALEDEVRVRRQEIQSFHEKAVRIQELLEWEEVPLELQVLESAARKELEQISQLSDGQQDPGRDPAPTVDRIETGPASLLSQGVEEQDGHFGLDVGVRGQWRSTDGGGEQEELMWSDDNVTPPAEELPQIDAVEREPCPDLGGEDQLPAGPELWSGQGAGTADDTVPMTGGPAQLLQVEAYRGTLSDAGCLVDTLRAEQESTESSVQRIGKSRAGIEEKVREKEEVLQEIAGVSDWMQRTTSQLDAGDSEHDGASATGPEGVQEALSAQRQVVTELSHRLQSRCTERNTPIPTGLTAHIQQTARALDNMEEKLGARSPQDSRSRELSTRIRETTGRLQGVEEMLQQRSKTVSEAKARQKRIWCEIDEWYSVLSQLDGEVQELAEEDPELAQELMETVLDSFQQHQQVSHLAEQRTALVNKIPECLEVYEQVTQSATSWIQSTEALLSDAIDYTSAKSLSKQLFALQMLAETSRQQQQSLRDIGAGLTELAVMFDTGHMVQQVNRQLDSAAALQQALAQRAAQTQELASEIGAIESEVKTLESKLSKVKAILFSAELGDLPVQEHLTNRQIILENLEEMREVAGVLAECGKSLVLPQGPTGTVEVFTRAARVAMEVPRLQELTTRQSSLLESLLEKLQECDTETERLQKEDDFETQEERLVDLSKQRLSLVSSTQEALNEVTRTFARGQQSPPPQADQPREPECPQPGNVFGKLSSLLEEDEEEGEGKESAEGTHLPAPPPDVDTQGLEGLDVCRERAGDLERWLESTRELLGAGVWSLTMQRSVEERLRQSQNTLLEIEEQLVHLMDGAPERSPESQPELESLSAQLTALRGSLTAFQAQLEQGQIPAQDQETEQSEPACPTEEITQHTKGTWHGDQQRSPGEEPIPSHPSRRDGGDPVPLGVGTPVDPAEGSPPHQQLVATWQLLRQRNKGLQKLLEDSLQQGQGSQVFVTAGELCSVPGLAQPAVEELNMWMAQLGWHSQEAAELATHTQGTTDEDAHLKLETAVQNTALRISDWLDATQEGLCSCRLVPPEEVEKKLKHHQVLLETLEAAHRALTEQTHALGQSATFSCPAALGSLWDLHTRLGLAVRCCSLLTDSLRARAGQFASARHPYHGKPTPAIYPVCAL
ncbi:nesprin-2-like [Pristis pectinata]|uniref:nesprin-2-like n=1 Tax=Pristis pectinata TaxID=685728 RepID=UPI00223DB624|nr:nesprin-2-like [Pristis pectinata]